MRSFLVGLFMFANGPCAIAETRTLFNGSLSLEIPDGFTEDYGTIEQEDLEQSSFIRLVLQTSSETVASKVSEAALSDWRRQLLLEEEQGRVIVIFEGFVFDPSDISGIDGEILGPLIASGSAASWHEALSFVYTSYLGAEAVIAAYDSETDYGIVVVPEISQIIHIQEIDGRPLIMIAVDSLAASLAYAKFDGDDELPDFSSFGLGDVEQSFGEAAMLDLVRSAFASADWTQNSTK